MRAKLAGATLALGAVLAFHSPMAGAEERHPISITEIRHDSTDRATRLTIDCTGPMAYTYYSPDPLTLVVDMPEVDASKVPSRINVGTREVESVRVTTLSRAEGVSLARVEVRLASLVPYQIATVGQALQLSFDHAATAEAAPPAAAAAPAPTPAVAQAAAAPASDPAPAPAAAPAVVVAAGPASPPENRGPATRILGVTKDSSGGQLVVDIQADGRLKYQDFFLANPDRLVVDFSGVTSKASVRSLDVNDGAVRKVRLAQFSASAPKVARLVVDLSARTPYHIAEDAEGLRIVFGEGEAPRPAPLAALKPDAEPAADLAAAPMAASVVSLPPLAAPAPMPAPQAPPAPISQNSPQTGGTIVVPGTQHNFTGHPISLDFKDGDLQDIFRLFADISGLNVVVNPGISGKVTLKLTEVPWDQALDLILKANGLGYTLDNNVIRIARIADLQREESDRRKLSEEQALAGDLADLSAPLSYAKADALSGVLRSAGALSPRGSITLDARTNTMLVRDLPAYIRKAQAIIAELDRPTPQVEIEARIVVTSRNFTRDLGIQWGFTHAQTPALGNETDLTFPNTILVDGGALHSTNGLTAPNGRGYAVNLPGAGANSALGISMGNIIGSFNLDLALTALERQGRGRLLSTPKVTTQNNQSAEIKQGVQIPIQTVANNTVTVTFKDAVLTLKVTPQITEAGTVILQLEVENNAADFANLVNGIPPINTQSAKTQVLVRDGATAVIGGIYQSSEQTSQQNTPWLSHLPVLGYLFRNRFIQSTNNELLLFITPRIIKG